MGIFEDQLAEGRILAKLPQFRRKEEKAHCDIQYFLTCASPSYVSLSWGKQSSIVAHLVYVVDPSILMVHWSNAKAEFLANFKATRDCFLQQWPVNYREFPEGDTDLRGNGHRLMQEYSLHGVIMGLAAEESKGRKYSTVFGNQTIRQYQNGTWRCCPLANWKMFDLAAYLAKYSLPVLSTYHRFGLEVRTSTGVSLGSHSERGLDLLSSTQQEDVLS